MFLIYTFKLSIYFIKFSENCDLTPPPPLFQNARTFNKTITVRLFSEAELYEFMKPTLNPATATLYFVNYKSRNKENGKRKCF